MLGLVDRLSHWLALVAAWLFVATGAMLAYEVGARYLFNQPTIWAEELSRLFLVWGTFLAMAWLLKRRSHIRITMVLQWLGPRGRRVLDALSLIFIAGFCLVACWWGWEIAYDSLVRGRSTGTMLNIPNWWEQIAVPVGFLMLFAQSMAELAKCVLGRGNDELNSGL